MQEIGNCSETVYLMFIFSNCNLKYISPRCHCGHCQIMDKEHESVCCKEVHEIVSLCLQMVAEGEAAEAPQCITDHPGFLAVCTNKYVLHGFNTNSSTRSHMKGQNISNCAILHTDKWLDGVGVFYGKR